MSLNIIDIFLLLIILTSMAFGWYRGFILGLLDLMRWIGSVIFAFIFYNSLARLLGEFTDWTDIWNRPAAFIFLVIFFGIILQILGNILIKQLPKDIHKNSFNRLFGILPGFVSGTVITAVIAASLFAVPFDEDFQNSLNESRLAEPLAVYSDELETMLSPIFEDAINETLTRRLTVYPGSDETVDLPFKITDFKPRPDLEAKMLLLINEERAAEGLDPLEPDFEMRGVARDHSADMFTRGYFAHKTPEEKSPFDRMDEAKVKFTTAGENLALAPTLKIAHTGLMNSPGHRANILNPKFGRVGIGILDSGRRGLMVTQNFRN